MQQKVELVVWKACFRAVTTSTSFSESGGRGALSAEMEEMENSMTDCGEEESKGGDRIEAELLWRKVRFVIS